MGATIKPIVLPDRKRLTPKAEEIAVPRTQRSDERLTKGKRKRQTAKALADRERVYELYRQRTPRAEIIKRLGLEKNTVIGIISRGFQEGELTEYVLATDEERLLGLYRSGATYKQMALEMGVSLGTIGGTLHRLRVEGFLKEYRT